MVTLSRYECLGAVVVDGGVSGGGGAGRPRRTTQLLVFTRSAVRTQVREIRSATARVDAAPGLAGPSSASLLSWQMYGASVAAVCVHQ
jgi:hypothetical protein